MVIEMLFASRNGEPISTYVFIFTGPALTLVLTIGLMLRLRIVSIGFIVFGLLNTVSIVWVALDGNGKWFDWTLFATCPVPLLEIGFAGLILSSEKKSSP